MYWSFAAELLALVILMILLFRYYLLEHGVAMAYNQKFYLACLSASIFSILLNGLCTFMVSHPYFAPLWLTKMLNSLYFFVSVAVCSMLAYYLFNRILEHVYDKRFLKQACVVLILFTVFYAVLAVWNLRSGCLFFFDDHRVYHRGILNSLGYGVMAAELFLLFSCYIKNRASVSRPMVMVIWLLPPVLISLVIFQLYYPELLLNGTLTAMANLIIAISFQGSTTDRDSLTGLRNRHNFFTELSLRIAGKQHIHTVLIYLHSFSEINIKHGHQAGDTLLYEIGHYLELLDPSARAFRFGNVTFALILPWRSDKEVRRVNEQLQDRFEHPWIFGDISCFIDCSIASFSYTGQEWSAAQVMEYLEYSLFLSKQEPKGLIYFDSSVGKQLHQRKALISLLESSFSNNRFQVWYQPIYNCHSHSFRSAEALLRLIGPSGEMISPNVFIPLAEDTGLIDKLSWFVLKEVCSLLSSKEGAKIHYVSVNISLQSFHDLDLADKIIATLEHYHLTAERIRLEITERVLIHDMQLAKKQMKKLISAGIGILIDDFGTGYSNFSFVLDAPFECVKIDRSLIVDMLTDPRKDLTVKTLMKLFHEIDKSLVIEGVEQSAQAETLISYGADMIQGFFYAIPMAKNDYLAFLSS